MGVTAAVTAEPALYTFDGKDYKVHPYDLEIIGAFERHMEKKAMDAFDKVHRRLDANLAERALSTLMQDVAACVYTFGTPFMTKALNAPPHVEYMFFLCVKRHDPSFTRELAARMCREDYPGVIRAMNAANQDPNPQAPGSETPPGTD